mgnify:FL=1
MRTRASPTRQVDCGGAARGGTIGRVRLEAYNATSGILELPSRFASSASDTRAVGAAFTHERLGRRRSALGATLRLDISGPVHFEPRS